ncbi:MAG TPA: VOC family protein [Pirellulales bacterium]|jgi:hypothetical protein|nr:VOC family protein [Pirellulales bacterium]
MHRPVHFEFHCTDLARDREFYSKVFGWKFTKYEGGKEEYWLATTGEPGETGINGGMMKSPDGQPRTINSISVASVDASATKILAAGGKQIMPKMTIPGVGFVAYFTDPGGLCFGIFQEDRSAR